MPATSTTSAASPTAGRIDTLDALRVLACLGVVVGHAPWPGRIGGYGVSIFMVLSGFLITMLFEREWRRAASLDLPRFWTRRVVRLVPAYAVYVALVLLEDAYMGRAWPPGLLSSASTFTVNYFNARNGHPSTSLAHTWTLSLEQQFYLVWPLVFMALRPRGLERVRAVLLGVIVAVVSWRCVYFFGLHGSMAWLWNSFETRADALAVGCLLAVSRDTGVVQRVRRAIGRQAIGPAVTFPLVIASRSALRWSAWQASVGFTVTAVLAGILLLQCVELNELPAGAIWRHGVVRALGRVTYGTYLFHLLAIDVAIRLVHSPLAQTLLAIPLAFGTGVVVNRCIEQPVAALHERWRGRGTAALAPEPRGLLHSFVRYLRRAA